MACTECRAAKCACIKHRRSNRCRRCVEKKLPCTPHTSQQGRRNDLIKATDTSPRQRIQRSSLSGHIESPTATREVTPKNEEIQVLDVYCQGKRGLWSITNSTTLQYEAITSRVLLEKEGISRYLMCTSVHKLPQGCNGCFIVFRKKKHHIWHLGVVQSFFYLRHDGTDKIHLFQWTGKLAASGSPAFYSAQSWEEMSDHFQKQVFDLGSIDLFFVNKVCGNTFPNETISDDTRSTKDGGIQCSPSGPDQTPFIIPVERSRNGNVNLSNLPTCPPNVAPFYEKNMSKSKSLQRSRKRAKSTKSITEPQSHLSKHWSKPPPRLPSPTSPLTAIFVYNSDGTRLHPNNLLSMDDASNQFFFPSPLSSNGYQEFFGIAPHDYGKILQEIDGISREEAFVVLEHYSKTKHTLLDASYFSSGSHSYTKIFVDDDPCPIISSRTDSNTTIHHTTRHKIICQNVVSDSYKHFIPLSVGVVDPKLHELKVTPSIIDRIHRALGKNGIFTSRNRSSNIGSQSYIGRRSSLTVAQPNPSEGDVSSFWYYRQHINQCFWPFALKVVNSLAHGIKIVPQLEFFHLSRLLPFLLPGVFRGGGGDRDFCLFAIITINFVNCIHADTRDKMCESVAAAAIDNLKKICECKYLSSFHRQQVVSSLRHIQNYGVTTPTTCGYQIVQNNEVAEEVEVIQYFSSYGLGTCHRIENNWVHSFLPALYSHFTTAPLFISQEKVYANNDSIDILGWGKGEVKYRSS